MLLRNATESDLISALTEANRAYRGNLVFGDVLPRGKAIRFTLRVEDSRGMGAHPAASGRRTSSACWHAHRDFMRALFARVPSARLTSALADYRGAEDFNRKFFETQHKNVGSQMVPAAYGDLCDC